MIAAIMFAVLLQQPPAPPVPMPASPPTSPIATPAPPPPVEEWPALPPYPLPRSANIANGVGFVRAEVEANRCQSSLLPAQDERLQLPVAILIGQAGQVRQIVPRAIGCPSVEQYVVGYLLSMTRAASESSVIPSPGWYQLTVVYHW